MSITLVSYVSGRKSAKQSWYDTRDSVGASVDITGSRLVPFIRDALEENAPVPYVDAATLDDIASDALDDAETADLAAAILHVCRCETNCGVVHFVERGR